LILPGTYDLYITNVCNLHCKNCSVLDWKGKHTIHHMDMSEVVRIFDKIKRLGIVLDEIKIVGGEPTLHKQFPEIIEYILSQPTQKSLTVISNGLNLTEKVIETLTTVDKVIFSVYPGISAEEEIKQSGIEDRLKDVEYWHNDEFQYFDEPSKVVRIFGTSPAKNWNRCYLKHRCRTITDDGLYRCVIAMNKRSDICEWNDAEELLQYMESDVPLEACSDCSWPPEQKPWKSLKPEIDSKNYNKGLELIRSINV